MEFFFWEIFLWAKLAIWKGIMTQLSSCKNNWFKKYNSARLATEDGYHVTSLCCKNNGTIQRYNSAILAVRGKNYICDGPKVNPGNVTFWQPIFEKFPILTSRMSLFIIWGRVYLADFGLAIWDDFSFEKPGYLANVDLGNICSVGIFWSGKAR